MLRINFFGDFKCDDVSKLAFSASMKELLRESDINVLNFEAPVRIDNPQPIVKSGPCISQDPEAPSFLENSGFNVVSLANNHIADCGPDALLSTVDAFKHSCGAGTWQKAYEPEIITVHDYRVGFIGVVHHEFGVLDEQLYCEDELGAAWMMHPCIDEKIADARKKCDFLFIIAHAGMEYEDMPLPEIRTLYRHWVDMGADGVIASHPHVPQPWESYKGKPIFYSLGNFCFDSLVEEPPKYWYMSIGACLTIDSEGNVEAKSVPCSYDQKYRYISNVTGDGSYRDHLEDMMVTFFDEESYRKIVDDMCLQHASQYEHGAKLAGYQKMSFRHCLRWMGGRMRGKDKTVSIAPLLDEFSCETHRWAIMRMLSLKMK